MKAKDFKASQPPSLPASEMRMGINIVAVEELDVNSVVKAPISTSMKRKSICGIDENT